MGRGVSGRAARVSASIKTKLIALTAVLITMIVAVITSYLSSTEIDTLQDEQLTRVTTYGALLAGQVRSAVAFADHETAREVLSSLEADPDVVAISLFVDSGQELYQRGTPSAWVTKARAGVVAPRIVRGDDRVSIVTPVQSLEGPRGSLVIELSNARTLALQATVARSALISGAIAILFGALAAWLIARSFARRLQRIVDVASTVSSREATQRMVVIDSRDEIGLLGEAFNQMLAHLRDTNRELESRVALRTTELSATNAQLKCEMTQRSKMEVELRQAQKLESVGRLASGIAHEINTPVQFVSDSCSFLETASEDLLAVIAGYRDQMTALEQQATEIPIAAEHTRTLEAERDVVYLVEQIPLAIRRALQGLERVASIVKAMKDFAYPDRSEQSPADLNRAIASTLTVAHNEYKYVADVVTDLGALPMVTCHVGELNQVVLNMVVNSAHAIAEAPPPDRRGRITVTTAHDGDDVVITIADDGCGMPQDILDKIFDPFFTTKEIGRGTGQGLAIARAVVVDKHGGKIGVTSEVGRGTTFTIRLPIDGQPGRGADDVQLERTAA